MKFSRSDVTYQPDSITIDGITYAAHYFVHSGGKIYVLCPVVAPFKVLDTPCFMVFPEDPDYSAVCQAAGFIPDQQKNVQEVAIMKNYFAGIDTLDALKAEYKRLVKENHPDLGGDEATMKAINNQYAEAVEHIKLHGVQTERAKAAREMPEEFVKVINAIIARAGLVVELVGSWIWVTGSTYENRDALKAAGYRFASKKRAWYWHSPDDVCTRGGKKSLEEIKHKYGATVITASYRQQAIAGD